MAKAMSDPVTKSVLSGWAQDIASKHTMRAYQGVLTVLAVLGCALAAVSAHGQIDEFGQHARPWAQDLHAPNEIPSCDALNEYFAKANISGELSPLPPIGHEPGERALRAAADRAEALDAYAEELNQARTALRESALAIQAELADLEALRASVQGEIARLEGVEDEATQRRIDLLRNVRPKRAAELLGDDDPAEIAGLLAPMNPRESGAILSALPPAKAAAVFDAMAPLAPPADAADPDGGRET